jgi:MoxR-like ATPase
MAYPYYTGTADRGSGGPVEIDPPALGRTADAHAYLPEPALVDAVNVALVLGQPLLLTGEPGTGKTQLAYHLAAALGLGAPLKFETKSTSVARDLFYSFDTLSRFHAAHHGGSTQALDYITYNALGRAILLSAGAGVPASLLTPDLAAAAREPQRSVVVIDEIDKAPRDFPNDLLNEIEHLYFRIPELGNAEARANAALRPVVVITSNSEKHLPDAFLRRCVFHHLQFPGTERLAQIVRLRLVADGAAAGPGPRPRQAFIDDGIAFFEHLRGAEAGLRKKPGTAELLGFMAALAASGADTQAGLKRQVAVVQRCLGALVKDGADQANAATLLERWAAA